MHSQLSTHICTRACTYISTHINTHICMHAHIYLHTLKHTGMHAHMCLYIYSKCEWHVLWLTSQALLHSMSPPSLFFWKKSVECSTGTGPTCSFSDLQSPSIRALSEPGKAVISPEESKAIIIFPSCYLVESFFPPKPPGFSTLYKIILRSDCSPCSHRAYYILGLYGWLISCLI